MDAILNIVASVRLLRPRRILAQAVELSGFAAIVYGVGLVNVPAAFMVGGLVAVVAAYALDQSRA